MTQKQGLQLFNVNGEMLLDVTDTLTRFLGAIVTPTNATTGSFTDTRIFNGRGWVTWVMIDPFSFFDARFAAWIEGNQVKWSYTTYQGNTRIKSFRIYYGAY